MVTSGTVVEFLYVIHCLFHFLLFVVLFEKGGPGTDQEIDGESEYRREKEDDEDREGLDEDIGRTVGDILDNPDDESTPDDEKITEHELDAEIDAHIGRYSGECPDEEGTDGFEKRKKIIHNFRFFQINF